MTCVTFLLILKTKIILKDQRIDTFDYIHAEAKCDAEQGYGKLLPWDFPFWEEALGNFYTLIRGLI